MYQTENKDKYSGVTIKLLKWTEEERRGGERKETFESRWRVQTQETENSTYVFRAARMKSDRSVWENDANVGAHLHVIIVLCIGELRDILQFLCKLLAITGRIDLHRVVVQVYVYKREYARAKGWF